MGYKVKIKENATGEIRTTMHFDFEYHDFNWEQGNHSCDCNRQLLFEQAGNEPISEDVDCSGHLFTAIEAILDDGTVIQIDD